MSITVQNKILSPSVIALFSLMLLLSVKYCFSADNDNEDDNFKWQDAAKEMESLPFSQPFIDSVNNAHLGSSAARALRKVKSGQFASGEKLVYEASWGGIKAGFLILAAEPRSDLGLIRLSSKTMTNNFVSAIHKLRDYSVSWIDIEGLYPRFFEQHIREGKKYKSNTYIIYDNKRGKLFFVRNGNEKEFETAPFTYDFLSMIYYTRTMPLNPGDVFSLDMFSNPKTYPFKIKVMGKRETVQVGAGTFSCVRVEPTLVGDGKVLNKRDKMEIWVSDDEHKYPVIVKSKVKVGSITAKLIQISK